ncbi:2TM domain-containing protein [Robiginitalea sp. SC105]|uniref:2TM domain-containing protein n=1 Tax=Robiginitalea sp. SC105 TaxID=2762332 RepID=UPI00351C7FE6
MDPEQHEQMEYAQRRIRQKKRLYLHFVVFLVGSVFLILINKILKYGEAYDWYLWGILAWAFLLAIHAVNVFVTNRFMGRDWERAQRERLVRKQQKRIAALEAEIRASRPLPESTGKVEPPKKKDP